MRTNRTFAANCAVTLASARINFGCTYRMNKLCGFTRRGLAEVALATSYYIPLTLNIDVGLSARLDWETTFGPLGSQMTSACRNGTSALPVTADIVCRSGLS
jgi:hypothetical protein